MTKDEEYVVVIIVDPHFGERLREIAQRFDLWVVHSPENRAAIEKLWEEKRAGHAQHDATIWSEIKDLTSESEWLSILDDIEVHHGDFWCDPPLTQLEIIGMQPNDAARQALAEYEYGSIEATASGFRARKVTAV